ncbi:ARM REPEAT PROTEIN INTERACTING WITH ABF2 [Diospyros lotus]|uniref:ARM REPEAT PROTEIN INTERACTING WITH ABF2 n=1 Tax=Diospyros lotus TaxID=55363 RepID=UPI0022525C99|nr:ARM REPEAT PROTEIN INTERACTING WITH ABF2 [Diospyros lotus]
MATGEEENRIEEVLSFPILLSERIREAIDEAGTFEADCAEVGKQVDRISLMLRSLVRFATTTGSSLYDRPVRRIVADVSKNLDRALTLVRKCKRRSIFHRVVTIVTQADFRKILALLDASVGDLKWLLSVFDYDGSTTGGGAGGGGIVLSLPPIASNDPILSWVWSFISSLHLGQLADRIEAANELAPLAQDNDRNKKIIAEEGGIPPLLKLLKESSSPDAQIAAATALFNLANNQERVRLIADELGVPVIVQVLGDSQMRVQIMVANLVARMAEHDSLVKEDFARENAIRPLVTLLSFDTFEDDPVARPQSGKQSIHSIVQFNKEKEKNSNHRRHFSSSLSMYSDTSSRGGQHRKERENESLEVKHNLKTSCAQALWMLARGSLSNSRRITETKGLLCLAKIIEKERGELQYNCLMAIMEITAAAESNADLRRAAFRTNAPAAKAVVDQLLRVIKELDSSFLQIPAIKSIGSLARTFPARETQVIGPLVKQLSNKNQDVATEAAISLGNFACPDNFLCTEHSRTIIEFNGVPPLMRLLRGGERTQLHGLILLCYLAIHAGNSEALEKARVLSALEGADRTVATQHPELKEMVMKAIYHLNLYHAGVNPHRQSYAS